MKSLHYGTSSWHVMMMMNQTGTSSWVAENFTHSELGCCGKTPAAFLANKPREDLLANAGKIWIQIKGIYGGG